MKLRQFIKFSIFSLSLFVILNTAIYGTEIPKNLPPGKYQLIDLDLTGNLLNKTAFEVGASVGDETPVVNIINTIPVTPTINIRGTNIVQTTKVGSTSGNGVTKTITTNGGSSNGSGSTGGLPNTGFLDELIPVILISSVFLIIAILYLFKKTKKVIE
jgi:hypothetical protein